MDKTTTGEFETPDYTAMDDVSLLDALGDDASQWAAAFRQTALRIGYSDMDEGWLIGWFANAIEHSTVVRERRSRPNAVPFKPKFPA